MFDEPVSDPEAFRAELRTHLPAEESGDHEDAASPAVTPHLGFRETVAPHPRSRDAVLRDPENRDLTKDRKSPNTESPPPSPKRRDSGKPPEEVGGFSELWDAWPKDARPRERALAAKRFAVLSPDDRRMAVQFAQAYRTTRASAGEFAGMLPYLSHHLFAEFSGAPEIDGGRFVITPDRPEWTPWVDPFRAKPLHG